MAGFANDIVYANNGDFSIAGSSKGQAANGLLTNGQMWIGTTSTNVGGTHINVGTLTSPDSSITIGYSSPNITLQASSSLIKTINGDTGSITGTNVTIYANRAIQNSGSSVGFDNSGTVSTLNLTDANGNTILGNLSGNAGTGYTQNVGLGQDVLQSLTTSSLNVAVGLGALSSLTGPVGGAGSNTAIGLQTGSTLLTGTTNLFLGANSGSAYNGAESNNVLIANTGVNGESRVMRLGLTSGGASIQETFVAGITGVTVSGSAPTAVDANGQLSSLGFGTSGQVLTSNGAATSPTWQPAGGGSSTYFQAYRTTNQTVAGGNTSTTIIFDTAISNVGAAYNTATGIFTAPATGYYAFSSTVFFNNLTTPAGLTQVILAYTGSVQSLRLEQFGLVPATTGAALICTASWSMPMTSGDTIQMQPFADGTGNYVIAGGALSSGTFNTASTFSGFRVA